MKKIRPVEPVPQVIQDLADWPIYKLHKDRKKFIDETASATFEKIMTHYEDQDALINLISRTVYMEKIRVKAGSWKADPPNEGQFWRKLGKQISELKTTGTKSERVGVELEAMLGKIIYRYSEEIIGNFKIKTFKFARKFLTAFFNRLLNASALISRKKFSTAREELYERMSVYGPVEKIRKLLEKGTLVVLPTHSSNLDSILVGYAMDAIMGLPAMTYGAGLNLYNSEIVAYYMNRLGAYRVDRRKKNPIYLETLKSMSEYALVKGTHSLFFPGGTRSRSGVLETKLKMGLLGTVIEAQRNIFEKGRSDKIFVVPCVICYHCVLEANQLINEHLSRTGKEKFLVNPIRMLRLRYILKFTWQFFSSRSSISLSMGDPMDVLGNPVDEEGVSLDDKGKPIEIEDYFKIHSRTTADEQREQVYTRHLARKISEKYLSGNLILTSHLVAYVAFQLVKMKNPDLDVFGIVKLPEEDFVFNRTEFEDLLLRIRTLLLHMSEHGELKLSPGIHEGIHSIIRDGVDNLGIFHVKNPLKINERGELMSEDFKLLYFYHNRLDSYNLMERLRTYRKGVTDKTVLSG